MFYLLQIRSLGSFHSDLSFYGTLCHRDSTHSLQLKVISATCKSQVVSFYLIHSSQIVTAVNKHFEKQAGIPPISGRKLSQGILHGRRESTADVHG